MIVKGDKWKRRARVGEDSKALNLGEFFRAFSMFRVIRVFRGLGF